MKQEDMVAVVALPKAYEDKMQKLLQEDYGDFKASFAKPYWRGIRANPLKLRDQSLETVYPYVGSRIAWCENGYYDATPKGVASRSSYYYGGFYYIQEPSAMAPVAYLDVKPHMKVLDLCAAPGGKSTQIAGLLQGTGELVTNDIATKRVYGLLKNIEIAGVRNALVTQGSSQDLLPHFRGYFDRILVDAPCSGEGMFRKDTSMMTTWVEKGPETYVPIQSQILSDALLMLAPGGVLVYSTCTFDPRENEEVVLDALNAHPDVKLEVMKPFSGFKPSIGLESGFRLYPHAVQGEGHFLVKLKKQDRNGSLEGKQMEVSIQKNLVSLSDLVWEASVLQADKTELIAFFEGIGLDRVPVQMTYVSKIQTQIYGAQMPFVKRSGLRVVRSYWLLGQIKNGRFEPAQSLASGLHLAETPNLRHVELTQTPYTERYFKGETLMISIDKGYYVATLQGAGVGFLKSDNKKLKNKFNPSWTMG